MTSYVIALFVGFMWAFSGMINTHLIRKVGATYGNSIRILFASSFFLLFGINNPHWSTLSTTAFQDAVLSGVIGILIGDLLLFHGLRRLGARRNSMLFSSNAVFGIFLGMIFLGENYSFLVWIGIFLVILGINLAILFAPSRSGVTKTGSLVGEDDVLGKISIGILLTLLAAVCQALGMYLLKPHLDAGQDPWVLNTVRIAAIAIPSLFVVVLYIKKSTFVLGDTLKIGVIGLFSMGVGSYLVQYAMVEGELGIVALLTSMSPIWILPMLWYRTGQVPHYTAWIGALIGGVGIGLVILPSM